MLNSRSSILPVTALALVLAGCLAGSASAKVTGSQVTSPADPTYLPLLVEPFGFASAQTITVTGTATTDDLNASDKVQLGCFYTNGSGAQQETFVNNLKGETATLTVHPDGSFTSADLSGAEAIALKSLAFQNEQPCTLRAVPPATATTADVTAFKGPRLGDSAVRFNGANESVLTDDYLFTATLQGYWGWDSAGSCGPFGYVFAANTFQVDQTYISDCEADLYAWTLGKTGASIVIDGHNSYDVAAANAIHNGAAGQPFLAPGAPILDQTNGNLTQTVTEPLVRCEASDGSPVDETEPKSATCIKFVPTGVKLVRTISTGRSGLQATVTDQFESTTGAGHSISLSYGEKQGIEPSYRFPGESSFATRTPGSTAPSGTGAPETIYFQAKSTAGEPENGLENPRGAITLSTVPDAIRFPADKEAEFVYSNRTVPATGSLTFIHILSQALTQSEVEALASQAQEQLAGPALSAGAPTSGATASTPSIPPPSPAPHLSRVGLVSGANGKVSFTLACAGTPGAHCNVKVTLTTLEELQGGRIKGVAARRPRSKRVAVGAVTLSIPAGQRVNVSLKLNATGRRLLAHFHKLPVRLTATLGASPGAAAKTVIAQNLTVKPAKQHKKHH